MGTDSDNPQSYCYIPNAGGMCLKSNLGTSLSIHIYIKNLKSGNLFDLSTNGAYDGINTTAGVMQPLLDGVLHTSVSDTFGCQNTVLPPALVGGYCSSNIDRISYREFVLGDADGDNKPDSGVAFLQTPTYYYNGNYA